LKKAIKILVILLGTVVVFTVLLAAILPLVIDPNDYKDEIIQAVKKKTGRDFSIEGNIELSIFPWLGVEVGTAELGNAPGFGKTPFAQIASAGIRIKVAPLLRREVVVDTVHMDGLKLNLTRNRVGATNWEGLMAQERSALALPAIAALTISGINIRNGEIRWQDRMSEGRYIAQDLSLRSGRIVPGKPVDLHLAFDFERGNGQRRTRVELRMRLNLDLTRQILNVPSLALKVVLDAPIVEGNVSIAPFNPRPLMRKLAIELAPGRKETLRKVSLSSKIKADLNRQSLAFSGLVLTLDTLSLKGEVQVNKFLDAPRLSGQLEMPSFAPAAVLDLLALQRGLGTANTRYRSALGDTG
jgi:AsmA protein